MMNWFKKIGNKIIRYFMEDELLAFRQLNEDHYELFERFKNDLPMIASRESQKEVVKQMEQFHNYFKQYVSDLNSLTAIDVHYKGNGFMVLAAKVKGRDMVKVFPLRPMDFPEYKQFKEEMEYRYGSKDTIIDAPFHQAHEF
jgi:hypothetical protein